MKRYPSFLILVVLLAGCFGNASSPLLKKSPYDADFNYHAKRISSNSPKTKHLKKMEAAYQSAQKADLVAVDSMLHLEKPDRWLYINAYHRRMQARQQKVLAIQPLETKDGYKPDFLIIDNLSERETASRQAAARYLYEQGEMLLQEGTHAAAREAFAVLTDLQENYYPVWENAQALKDSASILGTEHILVAGGLTPTALFLDSKWQKFYLNASERASFDIIINTSRLTIDVSPDIESDYTYTETADVEVGYTEKKDSNGVVIERSPIYESVSATVTETTIEKYADASVDVDVFDGVTGTPIYATRLYAHSDFHDHYIKITGDRRALSSNVAESLFSIFTPSYFAMEDKVTDALNCDLASFVRSRFWTDQ